MNTSTMAPVAISTLRLGIAAASVGRASAEEIAQKRRQAVVIGKNAMSLSFLKHSDEQTVLGMWTVVETLTAAGWLERSFTDWGVIAGSNFFSRTGIAQSMASFHREGPWGVSPHLIPHQSLHATAGTVSQALKIHGPNFGVGGGPNGTPDAFLLAAALLSDGALPGIWLVLTGHETEAIPARDGLPVYTPDCLALTLALTPAPPQGGEVLCIGQQDERSLALLPEFQLPAALADWPRGVWGTRWRLAPTYWLEWEPASVQAEARP